MIIRTEFFDFNKYGIDFILENGEHLNNVRLAFQTYGRLNSECDNVILVCHALTGNAHAAGILEKIEEDNSCFPDYLRAYSSMNINKPGWWNPLIGDGKVLDTKKYFVVCINILGSCYGSTGPTSKTGSNGTTFQANFPEITVRDMVRSQKVLLDSLGIKGIELVIGGSLGGMQVLEWANLFPDFINKICPIATSAAHSPWAIGLNKLSRDAIYNDPDWKNGFYFEQPEKGIKLAREIAMMSYRTQKSFQNKFGRELKKKNYFQVESYLNYQGDKFHKRFDANSYITISKAMDKHEVRKNNLDVASTLSLIKNRALCIGIDSDILYPAEEQKWIANNLGNSSYAEIKSDHGHDAFLIEFSQLEDILSFFLIRNESLKEIQFKFFLFPYFLQEREVPNCFQEITSLL